MSRAIGTMAFPFGDVVRLKGVGKRKKSGEWMAGSSKFSKK